MILAIDVGGTKTLVGLYCKAGNGWSLYKERKYKSADYESITEILLSFLPMDLDGQIDCVCAGVAGTVINGDCKITNLSWTISVVEIQQVTKVKQVHLLNDLAATAWAVALGSMQYEEINLKANLQPQKNETIAILSAGTGLGEAILVSTRHDGYSVLATEGGHSSFAPQNSEQDRLLAYLRSKYEGHVSYERLVSGEGLFNIYSFLESEGQYNVSTKITEKLHKKDPAEVIGSEAMKGQDEMCCKALKLFCEVYAAEAGNLALKCLPQAGVVLAGGISPKILKAIKQPYFMESFINKGRYKGFLSGLSVRVCMNDKAVLLGALAFAGNQLDKA